MEGRLTLKRNEMELCRGYDILGGAFYSEASKLFAFLSIFRPELSLEERLKLSNELKMNDYRDANGLPRIGISKRERLLRRIRYWETGLNNAQVAMQEYDKKQERNECPNK